MRPNVAPGPSHALPVDRYPVSMSTPALRELETTLYWLRWCAAAGQGISLLFAANQLGLHLPWDKLVAGVLTLAVFNALLGGRRVCAATTEARVLLGLAVDLAALTWALFHSGGVMNPFTMLYLLPVALTATVLPPSRVVALAVAGVIGYGVLARWAPALPHVHGQGALDLHLAGMGVNFLLSMAVLCAFGLRLASLLQRHAAALLRARERGLRDEGMHALALQAAVAAHSVNTPLATMSLLIDELRATPPRDAALQDDLAVLASQLDCARVALRQLVDAAQNTRASAQPLAVVIDSLAERAALLRPSVPLRLSVNPQLAPRTVRVSSVLLASLGNLLDNAADASAAAPDADVALIAEPHGKDWLQLRILDRGSGLAEPGPTGSSDKKDGLGWGLALANATLELHGGELHQRPREGGGTESRVRLPWSSLVESA